MRSRSRHDADRPQPAIGQAGEADQRAEETKSREHHDGGCQPSHDEKRTRQRQPAHDAGVHRDHDDKFLSHQDQFALPIDADKACISVLCKNQ
jgi:hypothetical protein